jgi:hypothetical protein
MATDDSGRGSLGISFTRDARQVEQPEHLYTPHIVRAARARRAHFVTTCCRT